MGSAGVSPSPHKERNTTIKLLNRGLHDAMTACQYETKVQLLPSQVSSGSPLWLLYNVSDKSKSIKRKENVALLLAVVS